MSNSVLNVKALLGTFNQPSYKPLYGPSFQALFLTHYIQIFTECQLYFIMWLTSNDTAGHLSLGARWSALSNYIRVQDAEYLDYLDYLAVTLYRCRIYLDYLAVTPLHLL